MHQALSDILVVKVSSALGAEAGQRILAEVTESIRHVSPSDLGMIVVFDVSGIDLASTSFFKSSVLPLFQSARLSTEPGAQTMADAFGLPALNVFPVLAGARPEVEELADEIFGRRSFPLLSLKFDGEQNLAGGRLVGFLDDALAKTLRNWKENERHTAASLQEKFPEQGITQTAWSNRLNDLWRVRLLRRVRQGKAWIYQPIAKGVIYG